MDHNNSDKKCSCGGNGKHCPCSNCACKKTRPKNRKETLHVSSRYVQRPRSGMGNHKRGFKTQPGIFGAKPTGHLIAVAEKE